MAGKLEYGGLILASLRIAILCGLAGCAAAVAPTWAAPRLRTVGFTRAVFRMDEGAVWGHVSGGVGCGIDYELLRWGQEGSEIRTERLGAAFSRAVSDIAGAQQDENLFEDARDTPDLQVAAAISDMRADVCEQPGLAGFRGSLSMTVQWQVYDPSAREIVGKFETHAAGQSSQNTANGVDDLFLAAFRANARDLMNDAQFERLLKTPAAKAGRPPEGANAPPIRIAIAAGRGTPTPLPVAVQSVALVVTGEGHGSGFLIASEGYVLTNNHVVGTARSVRIRWPDGAEEPGEVIRTDPVRDVAVVRVKPSSRRPLALHTALPAQGETVFAIGAPLDPGLQGTLTRGIVSANRVIKDQPFIQSDVAVTHGNSGGPLLDTQGEVIGLTVSGYEENGAPVGLNMFIPVGDALRALALEGPATTAAAAGPEARPMSKGHARRR